MSANETEALEQKIDQLDERIAALEQAVKEVRGVFAELPKLWVMQSHMRRYPELENDADWVWKYHNRLTDIDEKLAALAAK